MKDAEKRPVNRGKTGRQPNEIDESSDSQMQDEPSQQRVGELGRKDVESGKVDTDKGPVLRDLHENRI